MKHNNLKKPKKLNPVFWATRPFLSEPADPRPFYEMTVLFVRVFIIEVSILKKTETTLPKVFKTVALNSILFFVWPY